MRLWALLVIVGGVALAQGAGLNRTKRQFDAERCDPAYCQIPVSKVILMWDNKLETKTRFDKLNPHIGLVDNRGNSLSFRGCHYIILVF